MVHSLRIRGVSSTQLVHPPVASGSTLVSPQSLILLWYMFFSLLKELPYLVPSMLPAPPYLNKL